MKLACRALGPVEEGNLAKHGSYGARRERVMRATEHDGIDLPPITTDEGIDELDEVGGVEAALLDAGREARARNADYLVPASPLLGKLLVFVEPQRDRRCHHENPLRPVVQRCRFERRLDADNRNLRVFGAQIGRRRRSRRVARDNDCLRAAFEEAVHDVAAAPQDPIARLLSVRRVRGIAVEHEVFPRQLFDEARQHAYAAYARIEHADEVPVPARHGGYRAPYCS